MFDEDNNIIIKNNRSRTKDCERPNQMEKRLFFGIWFFGSKGESKNDAKPGCWKAEPRPRKGPDEEGVGKGHKLGGRNSQPIAAHWGETDPINMSKKEKQNNGGTTAH